MSNENEWVDLPDDEWVDLPDDGSMLPQAPPPTDWKDTAREAVSVASELPRGAMTTGGAILDFIHNHMFNPSSFQYGVPEENQDAQAPSDYQGEISQLADQMFGPGPKTKVGRYLGAGLGFAGAGGVESPMGLISAMSAGVGSKAAEDAGVGPWGQLGAALLGGASPSLIRAGTHAPIAAVRGIVEPFYEGGQKDFAARVIQESMTDAPRSIDVLSNALERPQGPLDQFKTAAEVTEDPGLSKLEFDIGRATKEGGESLASRMRLKRRGARDAMVQGLASSESAGLTDVARGNQLRDILETAEDTGHSRVSATRVRGAYENLEGRGNFDFQPVVKQMDATYQQWFPEHARPPSQETRDIMEEIRSLVPKPAGQRWRNPYSLTNPPVAATPVWQPPSWNKVNTLAVRINQQIRNLGHSADPAAQEENLLHALRDSLYSTVETQGAGDAQLATDFGAARDLAGEHKDLFDTGSNAKILRERGFNYQMAESRIPKEVLSTPENLRNYIEASSRSPQALDALRGKVVKDMLGMRAQQGAQGRWYNYINKNQDKWIEGGLFDPEHMNALQEVARDIRSEGRPMELGTAGTRNQSVTSNVNIYQMLGKWPRLVGKVARAMGIQGDPYRVLIEAVFRDKQLALDLAQRATPETLGQVFRKFGIDTASAEARAALAQTGKRQDAWEDVKDTFDQAQKKSPEQIAKVDMDKLIDSVEFVESRHNPNARSNKGAQGSMQLMPATARAFGVKNPYDKSESRQGGRKYLKVLLDKYGDLETALAGYHSGEPILDKAIRKAGSRRFADIAQHLGPAGRAYPGLILKRYNT